MATLSKETQHGREIWRITFKDKDGDRKRIRLGEIGKKTAENICVQVRHLNDLSHGGQSLDIQANDWIGKIGKDLVAKLVKAGLLAPRDESPTVKPLAAFLEAYIDGRTDVRPRTKINFEQTKGFLVERFGANRDLATITLGDADDFRRWLMTKLSDNTARRHCGRAKQFFRAAVRSRLIATNPFGDMKGCSVKANKDREYFVSRADAEKVIDACPDAEWRLIFALSRYAGLRCPSEHLELKWSDINWDLGRMTIRSPKTKHHEGKESRVVPIFPELRPYLDEIYFADPESRSEHVITRYRDKDGNMRTQLERIIARAGVKQWPKLFQNLRASRATELAAEHPAHVAAAWLGHSILIAKKHYWQVTDDDFEKAAKPKAISEAKEGGATGGADQNEDVGETVGQSETTRSASSRESTQENSVVSLENSPVLAFPPLEVVLPTGFEPVLPD